MNLIDRPSRTRNGLGGRRCQKNHSWQRLISHRMGIGRLTKYKISAAHEGGEGQVPMCALTERRDNSAWTMKQLGEDEDEFCGS